MTENQKINSNMTLQEARDQFYKDNGFPDDGGISEDYWSPVGCRDLKVYLPNFKWRRKAIPFHDLHHIITGYKFGPTGECQLSAWEFAAGRYRNIFTTLFCLPLVSIGTVIAPIRTFRAFIRGKNSKTLYANVNYEAILKRTVNDVRQEFLPSDSPIASGQDYLHFSLLVVASALCIITPFIFLIFLFTRFV